MSPEEIDLFLTDLKATLIELGGVDLVAGVEREAREAMPRLEARAELILLLDEIEGVLVHAPKLAVATMDRLGASSVAFIVDRSGLRASAETRQDRPTARGPGSDETVITIDMLGSWMENAAVSSELIAQIRERLDV